MYPKGKIRLDELLVQTGLAANLQISRSMVMSGVVIVNEQKITKSGSLVPINANIRIADKFKFHVGRGYTKLKQALSDFNILSLEIYYCIDIGASTGGFSEVILEKNPIRLLALDVGYGQLAQRIANDKKVIVLDRFHTKDLIWQKIPDSEKFKYFFFSVDISFNTLKLPIDVIMKLKKTRPDAEIISVALLKPQFECDPSFLVKGILKNNFNRFLTLLKFLRYVKSLSGIKLLGIRPSALKGTEGNQEYFLYLEFL